MKQESMKLKQQQQQQTWIPFFKHGDWSEINLFLQNSAWKTNTWNRKNSFSKWVVKTRASQTFPHHGFQNCFTFASDLIRKATVNATFLTVPFTAHGHFRI